MSLCLHLLPRTLFILRPHFLFTLFIFHSANYSLLFRSSPHSNILSFSASLFLYSTLFFSSIISSVSRSSSSSYLITAFFLFIYLSDFLPHLTFPLMTWPFLPDSVTYFGKAPCVRGNNTSCLMWEDTESILELCAHKMSTLERIG